ncbi:MAG: hypothetical protein A2383_02125 [Candidatus Pacebacteria bacterium RIFOXYB1_FULL_39_46]|nr:MAG: hypothetical protein A2182_03640 [Candidatus Pacebacteria bacterium RIFOXYA1_FULL_38_18]OGJ37966.1 MAG: hypothetical protein A2383_02125 [Candidatus Pacebacteria bacterium RIFOXYB1_FULL_39_46]OGJ39564.1 MAG: hypothetical protein A2411_02280 [Candidatus Pacebacteria bacterium RIFOXYC1_FULL_39_21]OGJ40145.1 MAG: hypothetical protein A2582_03570 [Candidatus Pacebacteria bacterium RIFOXYD1_FULL_39_27]
MQISSIDQQTSLSSRTNPEIRTFRTAFLLTILLTAITGIFFSFLQPVIPLFYTLAQPEKQFVHKAWIFFFPLLAWLITLGHFSLIKIMSNLDETIKQIFSWTTVGIIIIIGLLLVRVILLVT